MIEAFRRYWSNAKQRFAVFGKAVVLVKKVFDTDSTYWCERSLSDDVLAKSRSPEMQARIDLDFSFSAAGETIECIRSFREEWMNHPREIELGLKEAHFYSNGKCDGKMAAIWKTAIHRAYIADYEATVPVPEGVAFNYHIYVYPEFRARNISPAMSLRVMQELKNRGFKRVVSYYAPWNKRSRNHFMKVGFADFAYVRYFLILSRYRFWFVRDLSKGTAGITADISDILNRGSTGAGHADALTSAETRMSF